MRKLIPFTLGIAAAAVFPYLAGPHARAFLSGALAAVLLLIVALASRRRLQAAAKLLNQIAAIGTKKAEPRNPSNIIDAPAAAPVPAADPETQQRIVDVASALRNMGMTKPLALKAAAKAAPYHASFEEAFRAALVIGNAGGRA